jgi:hypothetical protein
VPKNPLRKWLKQRREERKRRKQTRTDQWMLHADVPLANIASHANCMRFLEEVGNKPGMSVLEIGSREVTGPSDARRRFARAEYVGFDYHPGDNVDVVGDVHRLSSYFPGRTFDLIYSRACFEHFAMPWVVAVEMSKLLRVGGIVFVENAFFLFIARAAFAFLPVQRYGASHALLTSARLRMHRGRRVESDDRAILRPGG